MIFDDATESKIRILHRILTRIRTQAYQGASSQKMGLMLDDSEYLTTLIFAPDKSNPGEFRALLSDMERKYDGLGELTKVYDEAVWNRPIK